MASNQRAGERLGDNNKREGWEEWGERAQTREISERAAQKVRIKHRTSVVGNKKDLNNCKAQYLLSSGHRRALL